MLNNIDFIKNITPEFSSDAAQNISSREKLVAYTMLYLEKNNIPLLFNYICIATFKLFPDRFQFGEFTEYPHIEMLNRTILHLRPKENNYAEGSVRQEYRLTELGRHIANEVEKQLKGEISSIKIKQITPIDAVKKNPTNDLKKVEQNKVFQSWDSGSAISEADLWDFFKVTPYSRIDYLKKEIRDIKISAKNLNNKNVFDFMSFIKKKINSLI